MAYGLRVWDANGNVRLDTTDREFRYVSAYAGTLAAGSSQNIPVSGLQNDGTWGLNETQGTNNIYIKLSIGTNLFTVTNNGLTSASYYVQVFGI